MKHYFQVAEGTIEFIETYSASPEAESVIRFTLAAAYELKASLEIAIQDLDHQVRIEKEELLATLRAKVEELEEHLAGA